MIFVSILVSSIVLYWLSYRYISRRFCSEVYLHTMSFFEGLAFGAVMTVFAAGLGSLIAIALTFTVAPVVTYPLSYITSSRALGWSVVGLTALFMLVTLQLANWLSSMITSRLMPRALHILNSGDGFRAAWAPTIVQMVFFGPLILAPVALLFLGNLNVH